MRAQTLAMVLLVGCPQEKAAVVTAPEPAPAKVAPPPTPPTAEDLEREALIEKSQAGGMFGKIDYKIGSMVVGAPFYALDFEVKQAIVRNVAMVGQRKTGEAVFNLGLYDQKSGKRVGFYSTAGGGLTME